MAQLQIRNPVAFAKVAKTLMAPRMLTLENRRVALWWNGKGGGDVALNRIGELIQKKFSNVSLDLIRAATTGGKAQLEHAKTFDAVIGATAD